MKKGYVRSIRFFSCFEVLSQNVTHRIFVCIKFKNGDRLILPGVSNFSAESLRRRFVMWWHMHETQILVHFRTTMFWLVQNSFFMTHTCFFLQKMRENKLARKCTKIWVSCICHHMTNLLRRLFALKFDTPGNHIFSLKTGD